MRDWSKTEFDDLKLYPHTNGFRIDWSIRGYGFGVILISVREDGSIDMDDECMGPDFVKAALAALVDRAEDRE
jgi:hypothetical protein